MASIQCKKSKSGKRTYYVVDSIAGKHKWIKAGTLKDARQLKRHLEGLEKSQRMEKLGVSADWVRILIKKKHLRAVKIGQWKVRPEDLEAFIKVRQNY